MSKKYEIDYTNFDPEKEYVIKNSKVKLSHAQILGNASEAKRLSAIHAWETYNNSPEAKQSQINGGEASGEMYKAIFMREWAEMNPDSALDASKRGGITQGNINKEQGIGIFGLTPEERSINAKKASDIYWDNATEEEIKEKYEKASESMKKVVEKKGWWNPHQYKTPEQIRAGADKMIATVKNKKYKNLEELYNKINTFEWLSLEEAHAIITSYRTASLSTSRRMLYSWDIANLFFEKEHRDNPKGTGQKPVFVKKRKEILTEI